MTGNVPKTKSECLDRRSGDMKGTPETYGDCLELCPGDMEKAERLANTHNITTPLDTLMEKAGSTDELLYLTRTAPGLCKATKRSPERYSDFLVGDELVEWLEASQNADVAAKALFKNMDT